MLKNWKDRACRIAGNPGTQAGIPDREIRRGRQGIDENSHYSRRSLNSDPDAASGHSKADDFDWRQTCTGTGDLSAS